MAHADAVGAVASFASDALITELRALLHDRCSVEASTRQLYGKDYSYHGSAEPDAVVFPSTVDEVSAVLRLCSKHRVPLVAYGSGTSLEGHTVASQGGICLSLKNLSRVLHLNKNDLDVVVEAGLSFQKLNALLKPEGLYFPLDAGPDASIGGMVSTCASGTKAVRYGTMKHNVMSLKVVLADGTLMKTGNRARKSSAGYDLTHLFVGSEGTLGVVVEVTLRVYRIPDFIAAALVAFPTIGAAAEAVRELVQRELPLSMVELLDALMVKALNLRYKLHLAEAPTLYVEFSAWSERALTEQEDVVRGVLSQHGGGSMQFAATAEAREELFKARKLALFAANVLKPGADVLTTDVCVPISRFPDCIVQTHDDLRTSPLPAPLVGHAGDGNFHLFILLDAKNPAELSEAKRLNARLVARAIDMGGTCTGEHGVGVGKRQFLVRELGLEALETMWAIKQRLDPHLLLNPGKLFPDEIVQRHRQQQQQQLRLGDGGDGPQPALAPGALRLRLEWSPAAKL